MANAGLGVVSDVSDGGDAHFLDTKEAFSSGTLFEVRNDGTPKFSVADDGAIGDASLAWSGVTGTPTTLSGYGITDGVALGDDPTWTGDHRWEMDPTTAPVTLVLDGIDTQASEGASFAQIEFWNERSFAGAGVERARIEARGGSNSNTGRLAFMSRAGSSGPEDALLLTEGQGAVIGKAALGTTATDGFLWIASGAGTPTGTPDTHTGRVPLYYDSANDLLYVYNGSWVSTALT